LSQRQGAQSIHDGKTLSGEADQLLGFQFGAEDGDPWDTAADHRHFIAAMKARAILAVFEYLVR
jgi:hypothetical protein